MAYVLTLTGVDSKFTRCVDACPVGAFRAGRECRTSMRTSASNATCLYTAPEVLRCGALSRFSSRRTRTAASTTISASRYQVIA